MLTLTRQHPDLLRPRVVLVAAAMALSACTTPVPWPAAPTGSPHSLEPLGGAGSSVAAREADVNTQDLPPPSAVPPPVAREPQALANPPEPAPIAARQDLWGRMQRGFSLPLLEHPLVEAHAKRFEQQAYFRRRIERIRLFLPVVVHAVEARGLPMELALVPLVESALRCDAKSLVAATGCWQFMRATAQDQKLVVSVLVDQRRDLVKSTSAALDYLQTLHAQTQDWHLALAAYNWGIGRVLKLRDAARARGEPHGFADLAARMPEETRNYVPQIEALKQLLRIQAEADDLPDLPDMPLVQTVRLERDIDLALAARWAGLSLQGFMALNHAVQAPVILAAATPELLLPAEAAERFDAAARAHRGPWSSWTVVRAEAHTQFKQLAQRFGTTAQQLRAANGGAPGLKPTAGRALWVPRTASAPQVASAELVANAQRQWVPETVRITVRARARETLAQLAQRLHLPPSQLKAWNPQLSLGQALRGGTRVVILVAPEAKAQLLARAYETKPQITRPGTARPSRRSKP